MLCSLRRRSASSTPASELRGSVVSILIPRSTRDNASPGLPDDRQGGNDPPTPAQQARAARLAAQIAETAQVGFILPGTLTEQTTRCG